MARLESESKGGFYPTPPEEMALILKRVEAIEGETVTLLDPCAGEGIALRQTQEYLAAQGAKTMSYGIELEKTRAEKAKENLDYLLACGYEDTRMSHQAFSFMYLNPPFAEFQGDRLEKIFFRDLTKPNSYLTEKGVVILNIPQKVLSSLADLIAQRLENVRVYRFTDKNFPVYHQVIVYGYRKRVGIGKDELTRRKLNHLAIVSPHDIPALDQGDWDCVKYILPKPKREVTLFDTTIVEPKDIIHSMNECDLLEQVSLKISNPQTEGITAKSPAMPLKTSHLATAIAAGALPETMGDHLLVGVTKTQITEETDIDEETGKIKESKTYQSNSLIRVFSEQGIFDLQ